MRRVILCLCLLGCQKDPAPAPSPSQSASSSGGASAVPSAGPIDTHGAWWAVAAKSKVFTEDRRIDTDNRLKLLPEDLRRRTVPFLDRMAAQPATGAGFHDAAELARDAQDQIRDPKASSSDHAPVFRAIAETSLIILHGLVAKSCAEHADPASLKTLAAAIRQAPLPRIPAPGLGQLSDGRHERNQIEQEMQMALDAKVFQAAFAGAPSPAKNAP
jgi:hypothetical protein